RMMARAAAGSVGMPTSGRALRTTAVSTWARPASRSTTAPTESGRVCVLSPAAAAMRIYLISPTHYLSDGTLAKHPHYWTSAITLPYLRALTPPGHDVSTVDEIIADVDLDADVDVVGLTAMG